MNQAPTSLNLLTNPASTDFSVSRIMLKPPNTGSPPFADFLAQDTGTNILSQVPYLQSGAKYVGLSRNDRFMIAATNDKLALFQLECQDRSKFAVDYQNLQCMLCSTMAAFAANQTWCLNDPSAKLYTYSVACDSPNQNFYVKVQNYDFLTFAPIEGIFTANTGMFFDKTYITANSPPTHIVTSKTLSPPVTLPTLGQLDLLVNYNLGLSSTVNPGQTVRLYVSDIGSFTIEELIGLQQITLVSHQITYFWVDANYQCGLNNLTQAWNPSNSSCVNCLKIADFNSNSAICKNVFQVRFLNWTIAMDFSKASQMNQTTFFGFIRFSDFDNNLYFSNNAVSVLDHFTVSLKDNPSNTVTLEYDPQQTLTVASREIYFKIKLNQNIQQNDQVVFTQKNTILEEFTLSYNSIEEFSLLNMVDYNDAKQFIQLRRCNYLQETMNRDTNQCIACLDEVMFNTNKQICRTGVTSRFFDWVVEKSQEQDEDSDGNIYVGVRVKEFNIGNPIFLPNTTTFLMNVQVKLTDPQYNVTFFIDSVEMVGTFVGWPDEAPPSSLPDLLYKVKIIPSKKLGTQSHDNLSLEFKIPDGLETHNFFRTPPNTLIIGEKFGNIVKKTPTPNFVIKPIPQELENPPKSPQLVEVTEQKPTEQFIKNEGSIKSSMYAAAGVSAASGVASVCSVGFMNFGTALIKMFQVIEILGKLLYLPIYFQGLLLNVLYSVEQLSSLVSLPSSLIFPTEGAQKSRYWTKFTIYENEENVFQSEVIASLALSIFLIAFLILKVLTSIFKTSARLKKVSKMVQQAYCQIVEMIVVDIIFAAYYNLITDYKKEITVSRIVGKTFSCISVVMIFGHYLSMLEQSIFRPQQLGEIEHQLITEGLDKSAVKASFLVRTLNTNFKFKILLLMGALVTFQNDKKTCIISMLIIQSLYILQVICCLVKHKKVYESFMDFLSMLFIEMSIFTLLITCCIFYIWESIINFKDYLAQKRSGLESGFIYALVGFIGLSMLMELTKVVIELCKLVKEKCRKKTPEEKLKQLNKQKMTQEEKMKRYWRGSKVWISSSLKVNKVHPQAELSSTNFSSINESRQNFAISRPPRRFPTLKSEVQENQIPEFAPSKLKFDDPLRIAKRKRVDYGNVFNKDKENPLKNANRISGEQVDELHDASVKTKDKFKKTEKFEEHTAKVEAFRYKKGPKKQTFITIGQNLLGIDDQGQLKQTQIENTSKNVKEPLNFDDIPEQKEEHDIKGPSTLKLQKNPKIRKSGSKFSKRETPKAADNQLRLTTFC